MNSFSIFDSFGNMQQYTFLPFLRFWWCVCISAEAWAIALLFSQVVKTLQGRRDEDQVAIAKQAQRTKAEIATLNDNVSALQAVNADMKGEND